MSNDDDITPEVFAQMVGLAALELGPDEAEYLRKQLNGQLKAVRELERIPIGDDVPPAAHGVPFPPAVRQPLRTDVARVDADLAQRILAQAPESDEGYFVVPEIPHTDL
jgi:aspartyl/glutamyl-tRNA(Asn/Gln) amidotransferase C subunit